MICAQEQKVYNTPALREYPLSSATNVYAVEKTMRTLMSLDDPPDEGDRSEPDYCEGFGKGTLPMPQSVYAKYPQNLISLVQRCMEDLPERRISASDLLREITRVVLEYPEDYDSVPMKFRGLGPGEKVRTKPDLYALFAQ